MEDPEHEDVVCKNPDCKKPNQKLNTILRHIALAKSCKNHYSIEDKEVLKARSVEIQAKKKLKRKNENYDPVATKAAYDPAKRKAKYNPVAAKKAYDPAKSKAKYDPVAAKKAYDPAKRKAKYDPVAAKKAYDPAKSKAKYDPVANKESYNPEKRSKVYQEKKLQEQKSSKLRIRKFIHECQFGPIFTCLCCKRDLFKRGVRGFMKKK
jgi:hypothetical protein